MIANPVTADLRAKAADPQLFLRSALTSPPIKLTSNSVSNQHFGICPWFESIVLTIYCQYKRHTKALYSWPTQHKETRTTRRGRKPKRSLHSMFSCFFIVSIHWSLFLAICDRVSIVIRGGAVREKPLYGPYTETSVWPKHINRDHMYKLTQLVANIL